MVQSLYRSWPLVSKITWGIRTTSYKQWQFQKVKFDGLLWRKTTFLQIKHYIQRIYLILLSITCVKIRQITYAISETISHFSQHNSSVSFYLKHYILSTRLSTAQVKVHQIPYVILSNKKSACLQSLDLFSVSWEIILLHFFSWKNLYAIEKSNTSKRAVFQTCHCSHWNSRNSLCNFWNEESAFLQTLHHSSLSWDITLPYVFI